MSVKSSIIGARQSIRRVRLIAIHTALSAVRLHLFGFTLLVCALTICGSWLLRDLSLGRNEWRFFFDTGSVAIQVFGSILAIVTAVQLFFIEIEDGTAGVMLSGRMCRWEWITGKLAGLAACLLVFIAVMTTAWVAALFAWDWKGEFGPDYGGNLSGGSSDLLVRFAVFGILQWMQLTVVCAITLFITSISESAAYATGVSFLSLAVCHLRFLAELYSSHLTSIPGSVAVWVVARLIPDFQLYSITSRLTEGSLPGGLWIAGMALYSAAYVVVFTSLAVVSIHRREL
jgi:ABC-type transport system involved in multi-copper enzyme maturation permease subunit